MQNAVGESVKREQVRSDIADNAHPDSVSILAGLALFLGHAATSKSLYPTGGAAWQGAHGNLVFNGHEFVTAMMQTDGALGLSFLNSNGVVVSNWSLSITGNNPRVSVNGSGYLVSFVETSAVPALFRIASVADGGVSIISTVATDVVPTAIGISTATGHSLAVWQSNGSPARIFVRALDVNGTPTAPAFPLMATTRAQQFPSVATDGTNFLVAWMLQSSLSNDWQTVAQLIRDGAPSGSAVLVSVVNSLFAHPTATVFGSNYLVAWSADEVSKPPFASSNLVYPMVRGGLVSEAGTVLNVSYTIGRAAFTNLNPAAAWGKGRFVATWSRSTWADGSGVQLAQPLSFGPVEYPIACGVLAIDAPPAMAFGNGRFCILQSAAGTTRSLVLVPEEMETPRLVNLRREIANGGITAESSLPNWTLAEMSTNLVNWSPLVLSVISSYSANRPQFFTRLVNHKWQCIDQLRAVDWARQRWQLDNYRMIRSDTPSALDLFGPGRPLPAAPSCPTGGAYTLQPLDTKPTCSVATHTL